MKKIMSILLILLVHNSFAQFNVFGDAKVNVMKPTYLIVQNDLNVNNGVITSFGKLTVKGNIKNNDTVILKSDASMLNDGNITGTGAFIIERSLSSGQTHYVSQPISSATTDYFSGGFSHLYDEAITSWAPLAPGNGLNVMEAYAVLFFANKTLRFVGTPNYGETNKSIHYAGNGWNLVGNPYPSPVDWESAGVHTINIDRTIYFWNGENYAYYLGGISPYQSPVFIGEVSRYIPAMQGFFVKAHDTGSISFDNTTRLHNDTLLFKKLNTERPYEHILLETEYQGIKDEALIAFISVASSSFDGNTDAYKLFSSNSNTPQIFSYKNDNAKVAINSLPEVNKDLVIPLGFQGIANKQYTIKCSSVNLNDINEVYLEDRQNNVFFSMNNNAVYHFTHKATDTENRFFLRFSKNSSDEANDNFNIYSSDNILYISGFHSDLDVYIYNVLGEEINRINLLQSSQHIINLDLATGTYIVKVISDDQAQTEKIFIK